MEAEVWAVAGVKEGLIPSVHWDAETIRFVRKGESGTRGGQLKHAGSGVGDGAVWYGVGRTRRYVCVIWDSGRYRGRGRDGYGDRSSKSVRQGDCVWQVVHDEAVSSRSDE